ncbi:MAG: 50S ribosomal protein L17, partial [Verrucomicrobia bacterium]|nr:50S ribosomal protein L17 [Verrucomicrobiota bacterium]
MRPFVEKIITLAKKAKQSPERALSYRRLAISRVRNVDAIATLFNKRADEFVDRPGGYTRIYKLGTRIGDAAEMAIIQLIPAADTGYEKKGKAQSRKSVKAEAEAPAAAEEVVEAHNNVAVEEAPAAETARPHEGHRR